MKKTTIVMITIVALGSSLYADSSEFYFEKGYKQGKSVGYKKGFEAGKKYFLKQLKKRMASIRAMEAGKYLIKQYKITAPKVFQKKLRDGSIKVVVEGCKLEKELTPEEIMTLPTMPNDYKSSNTYEYNPNTNQKAVSNSVYLPGVDSNEEIPHGTEEVNNATYLVLPNTTYYKKLLDKEGKPYAIDNNGKIKVLFENNREKQLFIHNYELHAGEDYNG